MFIKKNTHKIKLKEMKLILIIKDLICLIILTSCMAPKVMFQFNQNSEINKWIVVDDDVMGGKSLSTFKLNPDGYGVFGGSIYLENNGGFCSIRYSFEKVQLKRKSRIRIKLLGDGKDYQFRIKSNSEDYYSYITTFSTSGEWQETDIYLKDMYPSFRGRRLDKPSFSDDYFEEITFLIGNKKNEDFKLMIDRIELR